MSTSGDKCPEPHLTLRMRDSLTGVQRRTRTQLVSPDLLRVHGTWRPGLGPRLRSVPQLFHLALVLVAIALQRVRRAQLCLQGGFLPPRCPPGSSLPSSAGHSLPHSPQAQPGVLDCYLPKSHLSSVLSRHAEEEGTEWYGRWGGVAPSSYKYPRGKGGGHFGKWHQLPWASK